MIARALVALTAVAFTSALAGLVVSARGQAVATDSRRVAGMHENLRAATLVQAGVVRGDLGAVRGPARSLSALAVPPGLPDAMTRHAVALRAAALRAADAPDITAAATATAAMLSACGTCHRAAGTMPTIPAAALPTVGGTVGHMLEHQRAVEGLLRGLVIPSNSEWTQGARALRAAPLHARELPRDAGLTPELLRVEEAIHRLAEEAVAAELPESRVRVYGTLLSRCGDCHRLHQRIWGPRPR